MYATGHPLEGRDLKTPSPQSLNINSQTINNRRCHAAWLGSSCITCISTCKAGSLLTCTQLPPSLWYPMQWARRRLCIQGVLHDYQFAEMRGRESGEKLYRRS